MNETLVNKIRQCPNLPSLPSIAMQVLEMAQKESVDIAEIARIISKDAALSSKILRTVNSSFYGRSQHVSTISHALVILGLQSVKTLVLGFSLVTTLTRSKSRGFQHMHYWKRSVYAATAARMLAGKLNVVQREEAFLSALLKDIGMLVFDQVLGAQYGEIYDSASSHLDLFRIETEKLGMSHADVAAILTEQWKLPPLLATPIAFHHTPGQVTDPVLRRMTEMIHISGRCADVFVDNSAAAAINDVRGLFKKHFSMSEADCDTILAEIGKDTREVASLFEINLGPSMSFETILKKANEALVEITLRSQQQATQLEQQNIELKVKATTDGLTGLANRTTFNDFLDEQFNAAVEGGKAISVLLMDIDKFKSINDGYGHPVGDDVLRAIGKLFKTAARSQDLAARYGGEELVLVLPGTNRATASAIAESIRRAVAAKPIACDGVSLLVTASIGVASFAPGDPFRQASHLLKAADLAVYAAKHAGRNCVKVFSLKQNAATAA